MKSIQAEFNKKSGKISIKEGAGEESWISVCEKFNDDVSRICDVTDIKDYTGLFECFDDKNKSFFYLVREDKDLYRLKHKRFLKNIGLS